jgi:hypothetical protein
MCAFWSPDDEVSEEEWAAKERELEERDAEEEAIWESIIERVRSLSDDDLYELQKLFKKRLPEQRAVLKFLEEKSL